MKIKLSEILEHLKTHEYYDLGDARIENTSQDEDQGIDVKFIYNGNNLRKFYTDGEFEVTFFVREKELAIPVTLFKKLNELVELDYELDEEILSNCCSASIYNDTDICTECLEHCCGIDAEGNEVEL